MYTLLLIALTGFTSERVDAPNWLTDYVAARKQGAEEKKPVAVVVAPGKESWNKLARSGALGQEVNRRLAASYVCVHVDSETPEGKRLAQLFELSNGLGVVISDHTGTLMAFHHQGDLSDQKLVEYFDRFADSERVVRYTETNPGDETRSYYYAPAPAPTYYQPTFRSSGRGC